MKAITAPIEAYFGQFEGETRRRLARIREIMIETVGDCDEDIKYRMPTIIYRQTNLIHYAAFAHHIGVYPLPHVLELLAADIAGYKSGKGSIQFPNDEPLPEALIRKITQTRKDERDAELASKAKAKK
jgi:uncharacterized protein YdhG (YjbR/CyaY superfamily)